MPIEKRIFVREQDDGYKYAILKRCFVKFL